MSDDYYPRGQALTNEVTVRNADRAVVDPANLQLRIMKPDGTEDPPVLLASLTREGVGRYSYTRAFNDSGRWLLRWEATGPDGVGEDHFHISASEFP